MKTIIGIFDASLGARSNETSGRAINARKTEADTGTFHFIDNQARAIRHTGRIIIDLIPSVYNKKRIIRVMGEDKQPANVPINQPLQPGQVPQDEDGMAQVFNLTAGKYDLTVDVGPGFQTKREEAAYGMTELLRAFPAAAPVIGPELAKAQDWPGAEDIGKKLEALTGGGNNPQLMQAQQQLQQVGQQNQQLQQQLQSIQQDKSLEAQKLQIDMFNAETNRLKAMKEIQPPPVIDNGQQREMTESEKMEFDAAVKIRLKEMDIAGQRELALLNRQPAGPAEQEEPDLDENGEPIPPPPDPVLSGMQALAMQMDELKRFISAPRVLVRDEQGRPAGSRVDLGEQQQ